MTERVAILEFIICGTAAFKIRQKRIPDANISEINESGDSYEQNDNPDEHQ
jgi:hypothetical protein